MKNKRTKPNKLVDPDRLAYYPEMFLSEKNETKKSKAINYHLEGQKSKNSVAPQENSTNTADKSEGCFRRPTEGRPQMVKFLF